MMPLYSDASHSNASACITAVLLAAGPPCLAKSALLSAASAYLARCAAERLVDHNAGIGHRVPLVLSARAEQECAH
jgi:hypothetical protein